MTQENKLTRLLEAITQNTPDLIYVFDLNYRFTYANNALLEMWGRTWEESIGKTLAEVGYEPWHAEMHMREIDQVIATKQSVRGEVSFPHATLGIRYYDYIFVPVLDYEGKVEAIAGTTRDVTNQIQIRNQIEESEERFRIFSNNIHNLAWIAEGDGNIIWYNQRWLDYTGLTLEDMKGWGWQKVHHPDHVERIVELSRKLWVTNESFELTFPLRRSDGEYRWFLTRAVPILDDQGKIYRWIGTNTDIDDKVKIENQLKEREEKFRSLVQTLPQLVWVTDENGNAEFASFRWKEYSGIEPRAEAEWRAIVHPDDYDNINAAWVHSLATGNVYLCEVRLKSKLGEFRWHTVKGEPVLDKNNKIIKWVGAFTDIHSEKTFTKALEEQVAARTLELKASEEKFHSLFNLSPICKTLSDVQTGKIVMVNDAFTNIFGFTREEALNKTSLEIGMINSSSREIIVNELKENRKIQNKEIQFVKKSGETFFALTSAEIINIAGKEYFLGAINDITDRKVAEQKIEQKNIELQKLNRELQSFAYISSHDLQEPLRKIQTFSSRIMEKEEQNLSDHGKDSFRRMQGAAKRMQTLIQDLLTYSRATTTEKIFETTDLQKIIEEVKDELKEDLHDKQATIESTGLNELDIIPFQFKQLMHNLIGNSLKFSHPTQPPHIKIKSQIVNSIKLNNEKLEPHKKYCHISVTDNGIGFEQQYSERIFEVFQRLHGRSEYHGTGIGLSIVKKIVENHNGIITAKGEIDKGATFDIYIPIA